MKTVPNHTIQSYGFLTLDISTNLHRAHVSDAAIAHFRKANILKRLSTWQSLSEFPCIRNIQVVSETPIAYDLVPLTDGYMPLSTLTVRDLSDEQRVTIGIALCEALLKLHANQFYMGFMTPEWIHYHPRTDSVVLDIQPFPTAFPFVNTFVSILPGVLFSRYARTYRFSKAADLYATGIILHWLWNGAYPDETVDDSFVMPADIRNLCRRLIERPESFLGIEDVLGELDLHVNRIRPVQDTSLTSNVDLLHPVAAPVTEKQLSLLRRCFSSRDVPVFAIVSEDDTARNDVLRYHINEFSEHNYFITVTCRNLPFATLREAIDRITFNAEQYSEKVAQVKGMLGRKLDAIVQQYYDGDDVLRNMAGWFYEYCNTVLPELQFQKLYVMFDNCEEFDAESQAVFLKFWHEYGQQIPSHQIIFTGRYVPNPLVQEGILRLEIATPAQDLYERIILTQCARVEAKTLHQFVEWMTDRRIRPFFVRLILEHLIEERQLILTHQGWKLSSGQALETLHPEDLLKRRIASLSPELLQWLQLVNFLPSPIRVRSMFEANQLDATDVLDALESLASQNLVRMYHDDSVAVPTEVSQVVHATMTSIAKHRAAQQALRLQHTYRPRGLPSLIELARLAEELRQEYYFTIRYYRQIRSVTSSERKQDLLESMERLRKALGRERIHCWNRWLVDAYYRNNRLEDALVAAEYQYQRSQQLRDKCLWLLHRMFTNHGDVAEIQLELCQYVFSTSYRLSDRVYAAAVLLRSEFYHPLEQRVKQAAFEFYKQEVFPNMSQLSSRQFAEFTIGFAIFVFQFFPHEEDYASVLLEMLASMLAQDTQHDMVSNLYNAYAFHSNVTVSRRNVERLLEQAKKSGVKLRQQISHLNAMELSMYQGDITGFEHHKTQAVQIGEFHRRDLLDQYFTHQIMHACEWELWDVFADVKTRLLSAGMNANTELLVQLLEQYAKFRQGQTADMSINSDAPSHFRHFVDALCALSAGDAKAAQAAFEQSIVANGYHLTAGWSYRELISSLLSQRAPETRHWLNEFESFLKKYCYDVFWPDYYYLSAKWHMQSDDMQRALLYLRQAINGYQMIGKDERRDTIRMELEERLEPTYLQRDNELYNHPTVKLLLLERRQFLTQSLDLSVTIEMAEHVTESLDLTQSCQRLVGALFEYFPITHASIVMQLHHRNESLHFSSSGISGSEQMDIVQSGPDQTFSYDLYRQNQQCITLELYTKDYWDPATRRQVLQFLSVIKPHISNAVHYLEMMIDNLTGFYQRRYIFERIADEFAISKRYALDLSVIMIDIDNFRLVNSFGHPEGDKVLRELSDVVTSVLRKMDIPVRFGGEELLFILPKTDGKIALRIAHRLRRQIEEWFSAQMRPYRVTASVGVASLVYCDAQSANDLIALADAAEIHAKSTGKNKVVAAWDLDTHVHALTNV